MKTLFLVIGLAMSSVCVAGFQGGTVNTIFVRASDGLIYFTLNGEAKIDSPSCAQRSYWMIKDENSNAGKQQYQILLAAQASGTLLLVNGLNTCTRWVDGEDVDSISIGNSTN
jgi:hypothetical protein